MTAACEQYLRASVQFLDLSRSEVRICPFGFEMLDFQFNHPVIQAHCLRDLLNDRNRREWHVRHLGRWLVARQFPDVREFQTYQQYMHAMEWWQWRV